MQSKNNLNHSSSKSHKNLQRSTTLNRKYVKQPNSQFEAMVKSAKERRIKLAEEMNQAILNDIKNKKKLESTNKSQSGYQTTQNVETDSSKSKILVDAISTDSIENNSTPLSQQSKNNLNSLPKTVDTEPNAITEPKPEQKPKLKPISNQFYQNKDCKIPMPPQNNLPPVQTTAPIPTSSLTSIVRQNSLTGESIDLSKNQLNEDAPLAKSLHKRVVFFHGRRAIMAIACATITIAGLGYFVHLNFPDISARVTALQSGFDIKYPSYTPKDYQLSNITSDKNSKVSIRFVNGKHHFIITEEKSTWDSQALLNNFVKKEWQDNYSISREQGMTIYFSGTNATWVNGGILYKVIDNGSLDRVQLHNIIYSLQ